MARLAGKVAVITGGSGGIGLATAQRFVDEGAHVFIMGRRRSELDKAKALIGDGLSTVAGDVTNSADLDKLFATVLDTEVGLDILVANSARVESEMLGKITEENFDATFNLNARATLFTVQKALPRIRNGGSVILIGSTSGPHRRSRLQRLQRHQGRPAVLYPHLDPQVQRPRHSVQHVEPGPDRHSHVGPSVRQGTVRGGGTTQPVGPSRRDRRRCTVFGL
jgi:NAD(P)-dependent dehydrogenase (short-subunit alcohol dehydrogenase family)